MRCRALTAGSALVLLLLAFDAVGVPFVSACSKPSVADCCNGSHPGAICPMKARPRDAANAPTLMDCSCEGILKFVANNGRPVPPTAILVSTRVTPAPDRPSPDALERPSVPFLRPPRV